MKSQKLPLVSVLMPVYNAGEFLVEAIESVLSQTISDFEFFIIDDGSTDESWEIISTYAKKDKRIIAYQNKKRKGLVLSLNFLIPKTRGKYIARMDADDISLADRFEKQISYLNKNSQIVACGGQEYIIDENGRVIAEKYFSSNPKTCHDYLVNFMVIQPPLLMARGDIFRACRYDNHIFKNDDITIHFKLLRYGSFGNVDAIIFKYRKRNSSLTHKDPKRVYFLALKARVRAIRYDRYRPPIINIFLAVAETIFISILPTASINSLFEALRLRKESIIPRFMLGFIRK